VDDEHGVLAGAHDSPPPVLDLPDHPRRIGMDGILVSLDLQRPRRQGHEQQTGCHNDSFHHDSLVVFMDSNDRIVSNRKRGSLSSRDSRGWFHAANLLF